MFATCAVLVVEIAVGAVGTPVNAGDAKSALDATAEAIAIYSVSSSVPLTVLLGSPEARVSLVVKLVAFV